MLLVVAVVTAVFAFAWRRPAGDVHAGHDLSVYGPQTSGVIGFNKVHVGTTYRFAFPVPQNKIDRPIKLTGAAVQTIPAGAEVVAYPIYSLDEVGDYLLNYDDSDQTNTVLLQKVKDYSRDGVTIAPRSDSKYFVMVAVKMVGPVTQPLRGCTFSYTMGSRRYRQSFACEFRLGDEGP